MKLYQFSSLQRSQTGISGLFWTMAEQHQRERIRALSRGGLSAETISTIARLPLSKVSAILAEHA
jgi:hypothetical protein